ncbi:hypothetical protein ACLOJK_008682 [Asimina triloba]
MVSKIVKKTPTKPTKDLRLRSGGSRRKTPLKTIARASSIVISSINRSIYKCRRRLLKIFSEFATVGTPKRRRDGFRILKKTAVAAEEEEQEADPPKPLPPSAFPEKKTVFLDLDETLVHSKSDPPPEKYDFVVRPTIDGEVLNFYVLKRPGVDELLEEISKSFEIVVFTAGLREYAAPVLDRIDPKGVISHRLYRDSCKEMEGGRFVKDLSEMGRDLKRVVIVDDNPNAYVFQPRNAVRVSPFIDDLGDQELQRVMKFLEVADCFDDIRDAVSYYLSDGESKI